MCGDTEISFLSDSKSINSSKHLSESKLYFNFNDVKVFAANLLVFLKKFN